MKIGCVFLTAWCVLPRSLPAQEVTGNLRGRVVAFQSEPVPDVRVIVAGPSLQGTRTTRTDLRGSFQVLALPPGSYTVRLARIGFRPVVVDGVNTTPPHFQGSLPVASFALPYNFVRAVEVKEGGYDARYGRALGGTVNAVTYSGGNRFEGDVFAFFTNSGLTGPGRIGLKDV